jgi:hypothetical protein
MTTNRKGKGRATPAQRSRPCTATTKTGLPCQGHAQVGENYCGPHMPPGATRRTPDTDGAPSWRTIGNLEQARWTRTAQLHAHLLPPHLARLAHCTVIGHHDAQRLAKWCADNSLPLARAGRR